MALLLAVVALEAQKPVRIDHPQDYYKYKARVLVAYASEGDDNVDIVAKRIADAMGADLIKIEPAKPYPTELEKRKKMILEQIKSDKPVELKEAKVADYDMIFIGSSLFEGRCLPAATTFAHNPLFERRPVYPFVLFDINASVQPEQAAIRLGKAVPEGEVRRPLAVPIDKAARSEDVIMNWLTEDNLVVRCGELTDRMVFRAVIDMKKRYPAMRLQDVYKSFFQDRFGPGHIIESKASAKKYLKAELKQTQRFSVRLEKTGAEGRYVRVDVNYINRKNIKMNDYLAALMASVDAEPTQQQYELWTKDWGFITSVIERSGLNFENYIADRDMINQRHAEGKYGIHHSEAFNKAYAPHYRIISREQFESRIRPLIDPQGSFK